MRVGGQTVVTTEKHPFHVLGKGWTWAGELKPGQLLLGHDGGCQAVESVELTGRHESLYNLRVAVDRTYFVGSREWGFSLWVHNTYIAELNQTTGKLEILSEGTRKVLKELPAGTTAQEAARLASEATKEAAAEAARIIESGYWTVEETAGRSARAIAYQEQISGRPARAVFKIENVSFDGVDAVGELLEAKGPRVAYLYERFPQSLAKDLIQARDQVRVARGVPIVWYFAEEAAANIARKAFEDARLPIKVVFRRPI